MVATAALGVSAASALVGPPAEVLAPHSPVRSRRVSERIDQTAR